MGQQYLADPRRMQGKGEPPASDEELMRARRAGPGTAPVTRRGPPGGPLRGWPRRDHAKTARRRRVAQLVPVRVTRHPTVADRSRIHRRAGATRHPSFRVRRPFGEPWIGEARRGALSRSAIAGGASCRRRPTAPVCATLRYSWLRHARRHRSSIRTHTSVDKPNRAGRRNDTALPSNGNRIVNGRSNIDSRKCECHCS